MIIVKTYFNSSTTDFYTNYVEIYDFNILFVSLILVITQTNKLFILIKICDSMIKRIFVIITRLDYHNITYSIYLLNI